MKDYRCYDCEVDTRKGRTNFYMVQNHLWEKHGVGKGFLCLTCFMKRLGRAIQADDFTHCHLNYYRNPIVAQIMDISKEDLQRMGEVIRLSETIYELEKLQRKR